MEIEITAKFRASNHLRFEDIKKIMERDFRETGSWPCWAGKLSEMLLSLTSANRNS